jgi:outer membrane protein assembly factor BamB/fibronectin type 3 domain-containing protein
MNSITNGTEIYRQKSTRPIWLILLLCCLAAAPAWPTTALPTDVRPELPFILNQGQMADDSILFHTRTFSGAAFVKKNGAIVYTIADKARPDASGQPTRAVAVVEEMLLGATSINPVGVDPAATRVNFLLGSPEQWRVDTPAFHAVVLPEVYAGVDLRLQAHADNIEKIFTVAPDACPAQIRMQLSGIERLSVNDRGELVAHSALGDIRFTQPIAWQETDTAQRQSVEVAYDVDGATFGFQLGDYDATRPLMIDPLIAGTFIGGSGTDVMTAVAEDADGNIYAAGFTTSLDFPMAPGAYTNYQGGASDVIVVKFNQKLTELLAATFLGGSGQDQAWGIGFNSSNNCLYIGGNTDSSNFMGYAGIGGTDGFVVRLNTDLQSPNQGTYPPTYRMGGTSNDTVNALVIRNNKIYVAGETASSNFNLMITGNIKPSQITLNGQTDAFVAVFDQFFNPNASGATYLGGSADEAALALAVDGNGSLIVGGRTSSTDFPAITSNSPQPTNKGNTDAFVTKFKISQTNFSLQAATYLGGNNLDYINAVAVDNHNNYYVTGYTTSISEFPTNNIFGATYRSNPAGSGDMFITRLNSGMTAFQASTYFGGNSYDEGHALAVICNTNGTNIILAGTTSSGDLPTTPNIDYPNPSGADDGCLMRFNCTLTNDSLFACTYLGGTHSDSLNNIMVDAQTNSIILAGATTSTNFPMPGSGFQNHNAGYSDGFLLRINTSMQFGARKWKYEINTNDGFAIFGIPTMGWDGTIYVAGGSNLYAITPDGELKWEFQSRPEDGRFTPSLSGDFYGLGSTPAVDTNGNIYLCSSPTNKKMSVYCISADGSLVWVSDDLDGWPVYTSPAISEDGTLYVNGPNGPLYGLDINNGTVKYSFTGTDIGNPPASPAIGTNGIVYSLFYHSSFGHTLCAVSNGVQVWTNLLTNNATYNGRSSPIIGTNGNIYVGAGKHLYSVSANGATLHKWPMPDTIYASPAISSNGMIYIGNSNRLYSLNSAGGTNWDRPVVSTITSSPAIDNNGNIYVADSLYLYSFSPNGQTNWRHELDEYISHHSPLIGADGTIYMTDFDGLYAIYGPAPASQTSPWSTFSHDVLRTGNAGFDPRRHAVPTGVTASKGTHPTSVAVTWNPIPNAIHYEVWRSANDNPATAQLHRRLITTEFMDKNITPGQIYYYWVRAKTHVALLSDFSDSDFGGAPPRRPQGVTATKGIPTNYVQVTWQPSAYAVCYDIYRSTTNHANTAQYVTTIATTNYDDYDVQAYPGRSHYYWIKASNNVAWVSPFSAGDGVTNAGGIPPDSPTNLIAGKGLTSTNVPLNWDVANYDVTAYVIYRHTESNLQEAVPIATNGAVTTYNDRGSVPFRPYYYWVRATNQYGLSGYSPMDSGYTALLPPLSVTATVALTNRIYITWEIESTNATSYKIYRNDTPDTNQADRVAEVPYNKPGDTNFTDFNVVLGNEYYYFVRACNIYGESDFSPPSQIGGTFPLPPSNLEATDGAFNHLIRITWNPSPSPGALGYNIYRATTFDPQYAALVGTTSGQCVFDDLNNEFGKRYYYWATATNRLGSSRFSGLNSGWRPLPAPALVLATSGTSTNGILVTWSSVANANRYEIWRNTKNDTNTAEKVQNDWQQTVYTDKRVPKGIRYYYWIKSKNREFVSVFSQSAHGFRSEGEADLVVRLVTCTPSVLIPGQHPQTMSFEFSNLGPHSMPANNAYISAEFFLSPTTNFNPATAESMGVLQLNLPTPAGRTRSYTLKANDLEKLTVPPVTGYGKYYLFMYIDHVPPSTWSDQHKYNNRIRRAGNPMVVNATGCGQQPWNDYDGDGKSDPAVYRAADGRWRVWMSGSGYMEIAASGLGGPGYIPVPADYDGDGKTDPAVYRASDARWRGWMSSANYTEATGSGMGGAGYVPVPGDYDGDGKADPAVYSAATRRWRIWRSSLNYKETSYMRGLPNARPAPGAYDYDTKTDPAVYLMANATWRIWLSAYDYAEHNIGKWGGDNMLPVPGDYNGDGLTDIAVYHATMGYWFIADINEQPIVWGAYWGGADLVPVPGDYDGDGIMDLAVYHTPSGQWFVRTAAGNTLAYGVTLGGPDYIPAGKCSGF